jgi:hypothetical protein
LDKKMITLLVSEASAGALSRALVSVNGSASSSGQASPEKLKAAEGLISEAAIAVTDAGKVLNDASVKLSQANDDEARRSAKIVVLKEKENLQSRLAELTDRVLDKWALETRGSAIAGLPFQSISALDLRSIHRSYLADDDLGTLLDACLTSMEDNATPGTQNIDTSEIDDKIAVKETELLTAQSELQGLGRNQLPLNPADIRRQQDAKAKGARITSELAQLRQKKDSMIGSTDRTGLLRFCRHEGMENIIRLITQKISDRYSLEMWQKYYDFCKAIIISKSVPHETKSLCLQLGVQSYGGDVQQPPDLVPTPEPKSEAVPPPRSEVAPAP